MMQMVWLGIIDYGRRDWESAKAKDDGKFESVWCKNDFLAVMVVRKLHWRLIAASNGFDVHQSGLCGWQGGGVVGMFPCGLRFHGVCCSSWCCLASISAVVPRCPSFLLLCILFGPLPPGW
jgi:hypothetical protein